MKNFSDMNRDEIAELARAAFRDGSFGRIDCHKTNIFTADK